MTLGENAGEYSGPWCSEASSSNAAAVPDLALLLSIVHQDFLSRETLTANDLRQF